METEEKKKSIGVLPYIAVALTATLLILFAVLIPFPEKEGQDPTASNPTESLETLIPQTTEEEDPTASVLDTMKMSALIEEYYQAKMDADADTLNRIVVSNKQYNAADLAAESNIIRKYDGFKTYVIATKTKNYYIVYVTYKIYFLGIETGAPALNHFALHREGEDFVIYDKYISSAFDKELEATEQTAVVQNLKKQVEADLNEACRQNHDLSELMKFLEENAGIEHPTEEPTTSAPTEPTEEPSESASEENTEESSEGEEPGSEESGSDSESESESETESAPAVTEDEHN
ncbi:MAG: hypothetical protein J5794_02555 [Lachnospiraceae bacterium]|nr:hypothetical protein [Lachnospiraceae bacterium]